MKLKVNTSKRSLPFFHMVSGLIGLEKGGGKLVLGGGAIRSFINGETPNDFDLFIIGEYKDLAPLVRKILDSKYKRIFTCPDGYLTSWRDEFSGVKVQLITPKTYSSIEGLMSTFDLSPCVAVFDGEYVHLSKQFIKSVRHKVCSLVGMEFPLATMSRIYKYKSYGYNVHSAQSEFIRLLRSDIEFSEDQLNRKYID